MIPLGVVESCFEETEQISLSFSFSCVVLSLSSVTLQEHVDS